MVVFRAWLAPGLTAAAAALAELGGDAVRQLLRYDRNAIESGELWRLVSGHFVHLGWSHLLLNVAGLWLISYLVLQRCSPSEWLLIAAAVIAGIDAGFWYLEPQLAWYVGLSGLLHGLLFAGLLSRLLGGSAPLEYWLIGGLLAAKLGYEQLFGPLPGSESTSGGSVVVAAHLYGALAGIVAGIGLSFRKARQPSL